MTVPSDAGKAESLIKPTSSASVGAGGTSSMGVPDPGPRRPSRASSTKRSKGKKGGAQKGKRISTTIEAGEYRTSSGKVIQVEETTRVPMAESKKKQIRMATTIVFFSIVAAVVAVAVVGIIAITGGPGGSESNAIYNPAKNPYTLEFANVMGLPVEGTTVVVIEASEFSADWIKITGDMIKAGLSQEAKGSEVALIGAGTNPVQLAGGPLRKLPLNSGELSGWFSKLPKEGEADVSAAIKSALDLKPTTLIVVVGYTDMANIEAWDALIADEKDLKIHAVHIGNSSSELQGWMGERGGEMVVFSIDQIEQQKKDAAEAASEDE
ncbi:MAG: hypothetical protein AB8C95_15380 [Phycisphaeraceae bacterium]